MSSGLKKEIFVQTFFWLSAWTPPTPPPPEKILDPRMQSKGSSQNSFKVNTVSKPTYHSKIENLRMNNNFYLQIATLIEHK